MGTQVTPPPAPSFTGLRLGKNTVVALEAMAHEGIDLPTAAKRAGLRKDNLERAYDMPAVRERFQQILRYIRDNEAVSAYIRISDLGKNSDSDHVRLEANKWLAGVDGIAPVKRVESKYHHTHHFSGFEYSKPVED